MPPAPLGHGSFATFSDTSLAVDVMDKKRAEEALRESEEKFRLLVENIAEVFWLLDPADHRVLYVSPAYEDLWGRTRESLYEDSRSWLTAVHPEDIDRVSAAFDNQAVTGKFDEEFRIVRPDGSIRWVWDRAFAVKDESGQTERVVGIAADITERKRAEEELLRMSEERFRGVLKAAPDAMVIVDEQGRIAMVNSETEKLFGYEQEELIGQAVELLVPNRLGDAHAHAKYRDEFIRKQERRPMGPGMELSGLRKDGSAFPVDISLNTVETGGRRFVTAAVRDVTERKQMEERLRKTREEIESRVELRMRSGGAYGLTFREFTVLHHVAEGKSDKDIGLELGISPLTVQKHVANILSKMEAASRTEAGVRAEREGLLDELVPAPRRAGNGRDTAGNEDEPPRHMIRRGR